MKRKIFKYIIAYIILIISFVGLLTLTSSFSSEKIYNNVKESSEILYNEGNRKWILMPYRYPIIRFDNYTDALMINTAYSIDSENPLYSVLVARKNYIPNVTTEVYEDTLGELKSSSKYKYYNTAGELYDLVNGEKAESFEYARYWHGYLIVLRPLLVLFNLQELRILLTILLVILSIILLKLLSKKINHMVSLIFFFGLLYAEYFYLGFSLQGIFVFLIMMTTSIVILTRYDKIKSFGILFFITGMLTNFFDFLTVPMVTLGFPLIIYFLLRQKNNTITIKSILTDIIKISISWGIGYGLTWLTKWALTDLLLNKNLIKTAMQQVLYRSTGEGFGIGETIAENMEYMLLGMIVTLFITTIIIVFKKILNKNVKFKQFFTDKKQILIKISPYIIIGNMPIVWYIVLRNHSHNHAFFTYRNLLLTNICISLCLERIFEKLFIEKENDTK